MAIENNKPMPPSIHEEDRDQKLPIDETGDSTSEPSRLKEFFVNELRDILWAEQKLVATLPKMEAAATSESLKELFTTHLRETRQHVTRLEKAVSLLGLAANTVKCEAMAGIVEEGESIIAETEAGTYTRDAGLILAAQKVEHYEIATYGGLAYLAHTLGLMDVKGLLEATLDEEKGADKLLGLAASSGIRWWTTQTQNRKGTKMVRPQKTGH